MRHSKNVLSIEIQCIKIPKNVSFEFFMPKNPKIPKTSFFGGKIKNWKNETFLGEFSNTVNDVLSIDCMYSKSFLKCLDNSDSKPF